jgi:hypothetical protein
MLLKGSLQISVDVLKSGKASLTRANDGTHRFLNWTRSQVNRLWYSLLKLVHRVQHGSQHAARRHECPGCLQTLRGSIRSLPVS